MSLLESMSYGVVPVTTNVGSIGEIVKDGYNGLIIEKQDTMSIVEQCVKLVYNKELMNSLSQKRGVQYLIDFILLDILIL